MAFNAEFTVQGLSRGLGLSIKEIKKQLVSSLAYIGEEYINKARSKSTYQDDTGNLRASIGYSIIENGKEITFKATGPSEAVNQSKAAVNEVKPTLGKGTVLIVFAGMAYAAWVEAKGYDVITGSAPTSREVERDLRDLLG